MMNNQNNIPEEIQWQIFELLEGNLSGKESDEIQNLIRSNSSYQTFYRELSLTYLKPETTEYPNKSVLLKTSTRTFKIWRNLTILVSSAAAVALLVLNQDTPIQLNPNTTTTTTSTQKNPTENKPSQTHSSLKIAEFNSGGGIVASKPAVNFESSQKDTHQIISASDNKQQVAKHEQNEMPTNKPFRVIRIMDDDLQEFKAPNEHTNPDFAKINTEPDVQIVYTGFDGNESNAIQTSQTEFLLDIAENLRYGRLPKMKLVPRKRQNHLIPQVDMRVGTNTRFIQTTLIQ